MAGILGLVGSARPWGNSELLVRQVLRGARAQGADARMLRLTGLRLEPCTGCMRCVIGGKPCRINDDMAWLVETIGAADGLVLAAPTYFLGPAAVVKLVLDRLLMVAGRVGEALPPPRPAVTLATAGLADWRGVTLPYLNALAAAFGYRPIESFTAFAPGPGEVLLDEAVMDRALAAGGRLGRGELEPTPAPPNACPTCRCDAFVLEGEQATCPICGQVARVEWQEAGLSLAFEPPGGVHGGGFAPRWTPEGLRQHMVEWVMATGPRFMARRAEIKARRRPFRQMEVDWLCPPDPRGRGGGGR
jgi:NAD(P)H-dependent FMN reductase